MKVLLNIVGIILILALMYLFSYNRKAVDKKQVLKAFIIQFIIAALIIKVPAGRAVISKVSDGVASVLGYGSEGIQFVFGSLGLPTAPTGFIFAFQTLGNIVFISGLVGVLYYLGVLGFIVSKLGWLLGKVFKTSEVESFVAVANMFLGQTDSPILVSKYLGLMTDSEIMLVLVSGMGSMSVSIIAGYVALGIPMEALLIASTLVPVGSVIISKIICPQTEQVNEIGEVKMDRKGKNENVIDALSSGAMDGMQMAFAIGAALIAFISIVALINGILGNFGVSLEGILSYIFAPIGYFMGLDGGNVLKAGELLGTKLVLNEFVAYGKLAPILAGMDPRTSLMLCISLAGFANVGSIGMCVSGIAILCPEKKSTLARLGIRGMVGGFCVSLLSSLIVGLLMLI
ncbi:concentrative nucleoside transporter, CNT family [Peptostreptococcus russellii]|uniref:Concentrative nucleoside transporter, CNT family n=1 Tax=Peptostreptococcus russellii TaxID=215200 RepID=A0A1H8FR79_9FIRM|nr:nucleoside transporter C-terminal domain-containing protein [Peptostreptococcus russellii]SEN33757.1 concentrative nucleoside transporter, CNT family [Peptostreptococcus russellii]